MYICGSLVLTHRHIFKPKTLAVIQKNYENRHLQEVFNNNFTSICNIILFKKKKLEYKQILGSWKMKDVVNNTGQNISEKTTYYENGDVITEMSLDGENIEKINAKYSINKNNGTIRLEYQKYSGEFSIEKLDDDEFDIKDLKTNRLIRNIRY